jgi:hypothetical protein
MDNKLKCNIWRNSFMIRENKTQLRCFITDQRGGGTSKTFKIKYHNKEYEFQQTMDENYYILYSIDEFDCVSVVIDKERRLAEIHGIGNYKLCLQESNVNVGSTLLKITLKMLQKFKDKLNINKISLTDNSIKKCNNKDIILSTMLILLTGDTWYGKYGFRPVDTLSIKMYENNKKIMNTITLKDIDLIKYLKMTKLNKKVIEKFKIFIENHQSLLVKDYLTIFIKEYDKTCHYFYDFYVTLFNDLRLYKFYRETFSLSI